MDDEERAYLEENSFSSPKKWNDDSENLNNSWTISYNYNNHDDEEEDHDGSSWSTTGGGWNNNYSLNNYNYSNNWWDGEYDYGNEYDGRWHSKEWWRNAAKGEWTTTNNNWETEENFNNDEHHHPSLTTTPPYNNNSSTSSRKSSYSKKSNNKGWSGSGDSKNHNKSSNSWSSSSDWGRERTPRRSPTTEKRKELQRELTSHKKESLRTNWRKTWPGKKWNKDEDYDYSKYHYHYSKEFLCSHEKEPELRPVSTLPIVIGLCNSNRCDDGYYSERFKLSNELQHSLDHISGHYKTAFLDSEVAEEILIAGQQQQQKRNNKKGSSKGPNVVTSSSNSSSNTTSKSLTFVKSRAKVNPVIVVSLKEEIDELVREQIISYEEGHISYMKLGALAKLLQRLVDRVEVKNRLKYLKNVQDRANRLFVEKMKKAEDDAKWWTWSYPRWRWTSANGWQQHNYTSAASEDNSISITNEETIVENLDWESVLKVPDPVLAEMAATDGRETVTGSVVTVAALTESNKRATSSMCTSSDLIVQPPSSVNPCVSQASHYNDYASRFVNFISEHHFNRLSKVLDESYRFLSSQEPHNESDKTRGHHELTKVVHRLVRDRIQAGKADLRGCEALLEQIGGAKLPEQEESPEDDEEDSSDMWRKGY